MIRPESSHRRFRGLSRLWRRATRRFDEGGSADDRNPWLRTLSIAGESSSSILNLVGYILVASAAIDYALLFVNPQFTDPAWELRTIGAATSNIWAVFLGIAFIFFRQPGVFVRRLELRLLVALRWFCLLMGIAFFLVIPLGIRDTLSLNRLNNQNIQTQKEVRQQQFEVARQQLEGDLNPAQLNRLATAFSLPIDGDIKGAALNRVRQEEQKFLSDATAQQLNARKALVLTSARANLGATVAGVGAISLWAMSRWLQRNLRQVGVAADTTTNAAEDS